MTVVVAGVGALFGGDVVGEVGLVLQYKTDRLSWEFVHIFVLTSFAPRPIEPDELGLVALEGCLRPTFKPTLTTLRLLGIHIPNASQTQTG